MNVDPGELSLIATIPNLDVDLPLAIDPIPRAKGISVKVFNNGRYAMYSHLSNTELINAAKRAAPMNLRNILELIPSRVKNFDLQPRNELMKFLNQFASHIEETGYPINWRREFEENLEDILNKEGTLHLQNSLARTRIAEILEDGKRVPANEFGKFQSRLLSRFRNQLSWLPRLKQEGEYLYRAVTVDEWDKIKLNNGFIINPKTNFEDHFGTEQYSQVLHFSKQEGYAGKVIRVKVSGPFFKHEGMQVPRIESFAPLFAPVEVYENGQWVPLKGSLHCPITAVLQSLLMTGAQQ